jgi:hypothetical protein
MKSVFGLRTSFSKGLEPGECRLIVNSRFKHNLRWKPSPGPNEGQAGEILTALKTKTGRLKFMP